MSLIAVLCALSTLSVFSSAEESAVKLARLLSPFSDLLTRHRPESNAESALRWTLALQALEAEQ